MTTAPTTQANPQPPVDDHARIAKELAQIAGRRSTAQARIDTIDDQLDAKIREAFAAGMKVGPISGHARISKARVYQRRDGRR